MTVSIIPLVEEPVKIFPGNSFECKPELSCFGTFEFIICKVLIQRFIKGIIANIVPQHVKDGTPFWIANLVKNFFLVTIEISYQVFLCIIRVR